MFVASNVFSIAQYKIQKGWTTKAIYVNDTIIGFTMYGYSHKSGYYEMCRLTLDHRYQNKGYGRTALSIIIDEMKRISDCNKIYLSFEPKNLIGKKLYESFGFKNAGKTVDKELLYCLTVE